MANDRTPGTGSRRTARGTRPLGGLADLAELLGGESDRSRRLLGGLVAGAVVGAAIAGTVLHLGRSRRRD